MKIEIGNNNKIKNSKISNVDLNQTKNKNKFNDIIKEITISIISGLILAFVLYKLGWE